MNRCKHFITVKNEMIHSLLLSGNMGNMDKTKSFCFINMKAKYS